MLNKPIINRIVSLLAGTLLVALVACSSQSASAPNTLTAQEKADGWRLLFDGETLNGWRGLGRDHIPAGHWVVDNGAIKKVESGDVPVQADGQPLKGGDLCTIEEFHNFEFAFEWKVTPGANSGVKYNVIEDISTERGPRYAALGFEYQAIDDDLHADAQKPTHGSADLYDMIACNDNKALKPVGEWNASRIVFNGNHGEHWLNGKQVVAFELGTPDFEKLLAASKYAQIPGFGVKKPKARLVLQDHSDEVYYRSLKIKVLP